MDVGNNRTNVSALALNRKTALEGPGERCGTGKIPAGGGGGGPWGLMEMLGSATVYRGTGQKEGVRLDVCNTGHITQNSKTLIRAVARGIHRGPEPAIATLGLGGTYFFPNDSGEKAAIFKPCDEEPLAPCNPKGFVGRELGDPGLKPTVRVGEAALREVAAFLLDKDRFSNVPTTVLVRMSHPRLHYAGSTDPDTAASDTSSLADLSHAVSFASPSEQAIMGTINEDMALKVGSMQEFISHMCDTTEIGTAKFNAKDVQRIGILDVRLYNTDRHAGNILVRKPSQSSRNLRGLARLDESQYELVPIDHGFCLPEALEPPYFEWLHWPQARLPFGEEELEYIANLDIEADKNRLRRELPVLREECLRTMEVSTTLLKMCAAAGLSLHEIGEVMSRPVVGMEDEPSALEKLCMAAKQDMYDAYFQEELESLSDGGSGCESPTKSLELQFDFEDDGMKGCGFQPRRTSLACTSSSISSCSSPPPPSIMQTALENNMSQLSISVNHNSKVPPVPIMDPSAPVRCRGLNGMRSVSMALPSACLPGRRVAPNQLQKVQMKGLNSPKKGLVGQVYPPRVEGAAPDSANVIFADMDEDEWQIFVSKLVCRIRACLTSGNWSSEGERGEAPSNNLGISCPKF